jgi:hypothetical protein
MEEQHQIPLWFFIGALLLVYGILIAAAGLYYMFYPPESIRAIMDSAKAADKAQLQIWKLHAGVWWGCLLTIIGVVYCLRFNPMRAKK